MPRGRPTKQKPVTKKRTNTRTRSAVAPSSSSKVTPSQGDQSITQIEEQNWPPLTSAQLKTPPIAATPTGSLGKDQAKSETNLCEVDKEGNAVIEPNQKNPTQRKLDLPQDDRQQQWRSLFTGNKLASKGMNLSFVDPIIKEGEKIVELNKAEVERETMKWKHALIVYVIGDSPTIGALDRFIASQWNFVAKSTIYYHNDDYFLVKFNSMEDRDAVLFSGPYTLNNKPIVLKVWAADFDFSAEILQTIPLWIKLPNLPLNCWGLDSLSRIGSVLGIPLYADECTTRVERISYARLLVEMDVTRDLPRSVKVLDSNGKVFLQKVIYDWEPLFCQTCLQVGHKCQQPEEKPAAPPRVRNTLESFISITF